MGALAFEERERGECRLLDLERSAGAAGFLDPGSREGRVLFAGKQILPIAPPRSQLAALLASVCGLYSCDDRGPEDFPFYPVPSWWLFGEDEYGTVYGLVGECSQASPVGYLTTDGRSGLLAQDLLEFLAGALACPGWQAAVRAEKPFPAVSGTLSPQQRQLCSLLGVSVQPDLVYRLERCRKQKPCFKIYPSREAAEKEWRFVNSL